jgi:ribose transport system substrate-binding protein
MIAVNDLWFDFMAPSLQAAGVDPAVGCPRQISAGDGSVPAFERIRARHYQIGTVAQPLHLHGGCASTN